MQFVNYFDRNGHKQSATVLVVGPRMVKIHYYDGMSRGATGIIIKWVSIRNLVPILEPASWNRG